MEVMITEFYSQKVCDDADRPQIRGRAHLIFRSDFRRHKLWRTVLGEETASWVVSSSVTKVNDLELIRRRTQKEEILGLKKTLV
jgi:hypothetical protein